MDNPGIYNLGDRTISAALTDVVFTEGVANSGNTQAFVDRLEGAGSVTLSVEFDYGSGGTTCVVVVQTSINQGNDWIDIARFDFAQANRHATATISAAADDVATVAALSAEGKQDGILGDRLRAKVTSTGTYAGNTSVSVRAAVREASAALASATPAGTNNIGKVDHTTIGIGHGVKVVAAAGTDEAIVGSSTPAKWVSIQAQTDNTGKIAVGATGVDATVATGTGILLSAGEVWNVPVDNLADLFIDATVSGDGVRYAYGTG